MGCSAIASGTYHDELPALPRAEHWHQGMKLRCTLKIAERTSWSFTCITCVGCATLAATVALPAKPVWSLLYMTSTPRSKFATGFQIVRDPICQKAKSGEQLVGVKPVPLPI